MEDSSNIKRECTGRIFVIVTLLLVSAIIFLGLSLYMLYINKTIQSLLSLIVGIVLLSSGLAVLRDSAVVS